MSLMITPFVKISHAIKSEGSPRADVRPSPRLQDAAGAPHILIYYSEVKSVCFENFEAGKPVQKVGLETRYS